MVNYNKIVIAKDSSLCVKKAANELSKYIKMMTNTQLEITTTPSLNNIFLGTIAYEKIGGEIKYDGYRIVKKGNDLYIFGSIDRGTLYGVYGLLEKLGCKFLSADTEIIPKNVNLKIENGYDVTEEPPFEYRDLFWGNTYDKNFYPKININSAFLDTGDLGHEYCEENGGGLGYAGPKFVHTFKFILPVDEYLESHPEYFAEVDGKRGEGQKEFLQPCLSNPDVIRISTQKALEWLRASKGPQIVSISQNDGLGTGYCTCPKCQEIMDVEGSPSGPLIRLVNSVAEEVEKEFPNAIIDTLAYQFTVTPPKVTKPRDNVIIRMCTFGCYSHPITECEKNKAVRDCIETWGKVSDRQYIWDYSTAFGYYCEPIPNFRIFKKNYQFYRDNGVKGVFVQGNYQEERNGEFAELRSYVCAKLLWNPELDDKKLIDEFVDGYYGPGAQSIKKYLEFIHNLTIDTHFEWSPAPEVLWENVKDEELDMIDKWFEDGKALCDEAGDERSKLHMLLTEISFRMVKLALHKKEFEGDNFEPEKAKFKKDCIELNINRYSEGIEMKDF